MRRLAQDLIGGDDDGDNDIGDNGDGYGIINEEQIDGL